MMHLQNPFSKETKLLYLYRYDCDVCGQNGQGKGGLALHHIFGRISSSPLNASLVCGECHSHMGHSFEEQNKLFKKNLWFLAKEKYQTTEEDNLFWNSKELENYHDVFKD